MIRYDGNGQLSMYLSSGKVLELSEDEVRELSIMISSYSLSNRAELSYKQLAITRPHNKREKIIMLFNKYKSKQETKASIFREIAKELNISYKAVEKAYYAK